MAEENWDFYLCNLNDAVASIALDLAATAPDPERPWLLCVRIEMNEPTEHGLSSPEEADELAEFEDALTVALGVQGAFQVGRITRAGFREFIFYGKEDEPLAELLDDVVPDFEFAVGWRTEEDPEWDFYREFLFPDPRTRQWMRDRSVCDQLREHGDDPEAARPVDHWVKFADEASASAFAAEAGAQGFTVGREGSEVHLVRADPTELGAIHDVVWGLVELAAQHGGEHTGWGAPIVRGPIDPAAGGE